MKCINIAGTFSTEKLCQITQLLSCYYCYRMYCKTTLRDNKNIVVLLPHISSIRAVVEVHRPTNDGD